MIGESNPGPIAMLFLLVLGSFGYTYKATKGIARKDEIKELKDDVKHVSERVDKLYEHFLGKDK